jgi:hypothetical protein
MEALLVVAVLLVVGRLIGMEPAREVMADRSPRAIEATLVFATDSGARHAQLSIAPGAAGSNTFIVDVAGAPLPEDAEAVLRFALPSRDMGTQELRLPQVGPNRFEAEGSELSLPGDWTIEAIVRRIGSFSWATNVNLSLSQAPPPAPAPNPAPLFMPVGIVGLLGLAFGMAALAAALILHGSATGRRVRVAAMGAVALVAGAGVLGNARLPTPAAASPPVIAVASPARVASSAVSASPGVSAHMAQHEHMAPVAATPEPLPGSGTPVQGDGMRVTLAARPEGPGPTEIAVEIADDDGMPFAGARVAVLSQMPAMASMRPTETPAAETEPGRYVANDVPLGMAGDWRVSVRISPKGASTRVVSFTISVPG